MWAATILVMLEVSQHMIIISGVNHLINFRTKLSLTKSHFRYGSDMDELLVKISRDLAK